MQGAAAASTVYSLIPGSVLGANERINIGIIGIGGRGGGHIGWFEEAGAKVIALCDPDTARMGSKAHGRETHQDLRKLLEMKDVDIAVIATPNHWHSLAAIMACQAGKHVYVEKPVSHSIYEGRKMVEAARKYDRIVQAGTQQRSCPAVIECAKDVQAGKYGKVLWAHTSKLGSRSPIGKVTEPTKVPESVDYNLWAGPAPMSPVMRKSFHYDWHWQWNWGDGEMGNWAVHYIDDLRHILGWKDVPGNVISAGNRWWDDDGQTPNMHMALMEHNGVHVVVDIRNMTDPVGKGGKGGAIYLGSRGGNYIMCEKGYIRISRGGGKAYDMSDNQIAQYKGDGGGAHAKNFLDAVRAGSNKSLNCEIEEGHYSTVMCHLANIGYRLGKTAPIDAVRESFKQHENAVNTLTSIKEQVEGNDVNLEKQPFILGPMLSYDNKKEEFTGNNSNEANKLLAYETRKEFPIPEKV